MLGRITTEADTPTLVRRLGWFVGIYVASVAVVGLVALALKLLIADLGGR